jgi:hypothetical protein
MKPWGYMDRKKSILKVSPVKLKLKSTNPLPHHTKEIFPKISYKLVDFNFSFTGETLRIDFFLFPSPASWRCFMKPWGYTREAKVEIHKPSSTPYKGNIPKNKLQAVGFRLSDSPTACSLFLGIFPLYGVEEGLWISTLASRVKP